MKLSELYWHRITPLHFLLWPLSLIFGLFMALKRLCYWLDLFPSVRLPVPVIVVDSITVDNSGKTRLVHWLIDFLHTRGLRPGIISRGNSISPMAVTLSSDPAIVSGELFLLAQRCSNICPVWIGNDRIAVAHALLAAHPDCNLLISIDGLQYPRLERDLEIVVIDFNEQSFGNGLMLPAGPLRDNLKRLLNVDAIVVNGKQRQHIDSNAKIFNMKLVSDSFYNLLIPDSRCAPASLNDKQVHAVTSINNSQWFFDYLQQVKLTVEFHTFSEHHHFVKKDLQYPEAEVILMLEEDAVQCLAFADETIWVLPVEAWVSGELRELILKNLREKFMDKKFLDILVCPLCKGPLLYRKAENELICKSDHLAFPIRDGIPVMLENEARKLSPEEKL